MLPMSHFISLQSNALLGLYIFHTYFEISDLKWNTNSTWDGLSLFLSISLFNIQRALYFVKMKRWHLKCIHFEGTWAIEACFLEKSSPTFNWGKLSFWMTLHSLPFAVMCCSYSNLQSDIMAWFSIGCRENGLSSVVLCSEPFHHSFHSSKEKDQYFPMSENPTIESKRLYENGT